MAFVPYVAHLRMTVYKDRGQHLQLSFNKTKVHLKRLSNVDDDDDDDELVFNDASTLLGH